MQTSGDSARQAAERAARESYGRLLALLAARTHDIAGAEDALAEAFATALRSWPAGGVPANPAAWLVTVARRRLADSRRHGQTRQAGAAHLILVADECHSAAPDDIPDRRLALMFACAHPAIEPGLHAPLMLQIMLGFTAAEIAAAFFIPAATLSQRLVRAKARLKTAGIAFTLPDRADLPARRAGVLQAVYAAYTKGWADSGGWSAPGLTQEAIWLGQVLVAVLPDEPEAAGLLALMLYAEARRPARLNAAGAYVPLDQQDTGLWNWAQINAAELLLRQASFGATGRYQLEAAIQSAHIARLHAGAANWPDIVALYGHLLAHAPSPVVTLNRAVARAHTHGAAAALADIDALAGDAHMRGYQPYWAARGRLCAEAGRLGEAREALTVAVGLSADPAIRVYLQRELGRL